jgi:hypothetical protein
MLTIEMRRSKCDRRQKSVLCFWPCLYRYRDFELKFHYPIWNAVNRFCGIKNKVFCAIAGPRKQYNISFRLIRLYTRNNWYSIFLSEDFAVVLGDLRIVTCIELVLIPCSLCRNWIQK